MFTAAWRKLFCSSFFIKNFPCCYHNGKLKCQHKTEVDCFSHNAINWRHSSWVTLHNVIRESCSKQTSSCSLNRSRVLSAASRLKIFHFELISSNHTILSLSLSLFHIVLIHSKPLQSIKFLISKQKIFFTFFNVEHNCVKIVFIIKEKIERKTNLEREKEKVRIHKHLIKSK